MQGVVEFNLSDLTVRAVTKVRPGTHGTIQNEFRRQLREQLCEQSSGLLLGDTSRAA